MVIRLLSDPEKVSDHKFCWRNDWVSPFESAWGIFEKFKYANHANSRDILRLFGNEKVKGIKNKIGRGYYDLLRLSGFDEDSLKFGLGIDIVEKNNIDLKQLLGPLTYEEYKNEPMYNYSYFLRNTLTICPICIEKGFHSILFQFKLVEKCPYHEISLIEGCSSCHAGVCQEFCVNVLLMLLRQGSSAPTEGAAQHDQGRKRIAVAAFVPSFERGLSTFVRHPS